MIGARQSPESGRGDFSELEIIPLDEADAAVLVGGPPAVAAASLCAMPGKQF